MADFKNMNKKRPTRKRKGKVKDNSLPLPDYESTFLGFMRSNCGGSHFNIEVIEHQVETDQWSTKPTQAMLRGSIRKQFYSKAMPRSITERIVLVEESELAKQSANGAGGNSSKLFIILHCYTVNEIKELDKEGLLPPNYLAYTDSNRLAVGEKIDIGEQNEVVIQFEEANQEGSGGDDIFGDGGDEENTDDEENGGNNSDSDEDSPSSRNKRERDKKKDKKDKKDKKKIKKKKSGGGHRGGGGGGGADWINSI